MQNGNSVQTQQSPTPLTWKCPKEWTKFGGKAAPLTSDSAGPQQVYTIHVVSKVTENLQLWHQRVLLRRVSVGWDDIIRTFKHSYSVSYVAIQHAEADCVRNDSLFTTECIMFAVHHFIWVS